MVSIVFELDFFGPLCAISTGVEWPSIWGTMKVGDTSLNTIYYARNTGWGWKLIKLRAYFVPHSGLKKSEQKTNGAISTGIEWPSIWGIVTLCEGQNAHKLSDWLQLGGLIFYDWGRIWLQKWLLFDGKPKKFSPPTSSIYQRCCQFLPHVSICFGPPRTIKRVRGVENWQTW